MRFADTSFWVALALRRDHHHDEASSLWKERGEDLLATNHVLGEVWTFLRRRDGHATARRALRLIRRSSAVEVVHVTDDLEDEAWHWLDRHDERSYSFVDSTSFAVMRRRSLLEAFAFDGDFAAAGFVEVRP
ncbi:MAG: type II toxin-antitoxin system VapC family toxin [Acidimicrobiales bacterium]